MDSNQYATTVLSLLGLAALTLGTLAMIYRAIRQWLINRQTTAGEVAAQLVDDVKRGEGFTFMSSGARRNDSSGAGATGLANDQAEGLQPIATPSKGANDDLALGGLGALAAKDLSDITPAEARAIIRQQARAEAIVSILKAAEAGKVKSAGDQAGLIEAVAGGARTSRPGTPYQLLKAAVDELRGRPRPEYVGDLRERHGLPRVEAEQH